MIVWHKEFENRDGLKSQHVFLTDEEFLELRKNAKKTLVDWHQYELSDVFTGNVKCCNQSLATNEHKLLTEIAKINVTKQR